MSLEHYGVISYDIKNRSDENGLIHHSHLILFIFYDVFYILIIPSTFAMELNNTMIRQTGARYLIKNLYSPFLWNFEDCSISAAILSYPTTLVTRKQVASAASGIITELVIKSKKSRKFIPNIFRKSRTPYPMEDALPKRSMITAIRIQHFALPQ